MYFWMLRRWSSSHVVLLLLLPTARQCCITSICSNLYASAYPLLVSLRQQLPPVLSLNHLSPVPPPVLVPILRNVLVLFIAS